MPRKEVRLLDTVLYEWDTEIIDENGDIHDHNFFESPLFDRFVWTDGEGNQVAADLDDNEELVLVFNTGNPHDGITDRAWAYVDLDTGLLPERFDNNRKVPKRFHAELARWVKLKTLPLVGYRHAVEA